MAKIYRSMTELVGGTPLLELTNYERRENLDARLLAKLEYLNPAGSVKDRIAKAMLDEAERAGRLGRVGDRRAHERQHRPSGWRRRARRAATASS